MPLWRVPLDGVAKVHRKTDQGPAEIVNGIMEPGGESGHGHIHNDGNEKEKHG